MGVGNFYSCGRRLFQLEDSLLGGGPTTVILPSLLSFVIQRTLFLVSKNSVSLDPRLRPSKLLIIVILKWKRLGQKSGHFTISVLLIS